MRVSDLIRELEYFDENLQVVIQSSNSMYVDDICGTTEKELRSFYGRDRSVLVIVADSQVGAVD